MRSTGKFNAANMYGVFSRDRVVGVVPGCGVRVSSRETVPESERNIRAVSPQLAVSISGQPGNCSLPKSIRPTPSAFARRVVTWPLVCCRIPVIRKKVRPRRPQAGAHGGAHPGSASRRLDLRGRVGDAVIRAAMTDDGSGSGIPGPSIE